MRYVLYMLAILPLIGCSHAPRGFSTEAYEMAINREVGRSAAKMKMWYGNAPLQTYPDGNGNTVYHYRVIGRDVGLKKPCDTMFQVAPDGLIVGHGWRGACYAPNRYLETWELVRTESVREPVFIDCGGKTALQCGDAEAQARAK